MMRYIKSKKMFESVEPDSNFESNIDIHGNTTLEDIRHICLDLTDVGLRISLVKNSRLMWDFYDLMIWGPGVDSRIVYSEISEVVERLKEYLGDSVTSLKEGRPGFFMDIKRWNGRFGEQGWQQFSISQHDNSPIEGLKIRFRI